MSDDKKSKIVQLLRESTTGKQPVSPSQHIDISGNNNVVGNGNTFIVTEKHVPRIIAEPKPGVEHITEEQVRRLHDLKDKIVELEALTKRKPITHQGVWSAFNKKMGVGSMRMLPISKFKAGEKYLSMWIGRLNNSKTAEKKTPEGIEKTRLTYIRTNMGKLGIEDRVRDYMEKHFSTRSTTDLPDLAAITKVYNYVAGLKKKIS